MIADLLGTTPVHLGVQLLGLSLLAAIAAGLASFLFRWRVGTSFPEGPAILLGVGAVAIYLNTRLLLVQFLGGDGDALALPAASRNLLVFVVAGVAASGGWYGGDRLAASERFATSALHPDLSPLVRATGRFITVELPEEIEDIDGYEPVLAETRETLAGRSLDFPRGLTVDQLEDGLATRLKTEYGVGYVDVELTADGAVEYLGLGGRAAGIGHSLAPGQQATAIRADPAFSASPGDTVQIWDGSAEERIGTGELRAAVGRTVTVSAQAAVVERLDPTTDYRLMTVSGDERVDRIFARLLRRADETMSVVELAEAGTLSETTVGDLGLSVIAVTTASGTTETIPRRDRPLAVGERVFSIGEPAQLRKLEASATGPIPYEAPPRTASGEDRRGRPRDRLLESIGRIGRSRKDRSP